MISNKNKAPSIVIWCYENGISLIAKTIQNIHFSGIQALKLKDHLMITLSRAGRRRVKIKSLTEFNLITKV